MTKLFAIFFAFIFCWNPQLAKVWLKTAENYFIYINVGKAESRFQQCFQPYEAQTLYSKGFAPMRVFTISINWKNDMHF